METLKAAVVIGGRNLRVSLFDYFKNRSSSHSCDVSCPMTRTNCTKPGSRRGTVSLSLLPIDKVQGEQRPGVTIASVSETQQPAQGIWGTAVK